MASAPESANLVCETGGIKLLASTIEELDLVADIPEALPSQNDDPFAIWGFKSSRVFEGVKERQSLSAEAIRFRIRAGARAPKILSKIREILSASGKGH